MIAWLSGILDSILDFFAWTTDSIYWVIQNLGTFFKYVGSAISYLWSFVTAIPAVFTIPAAIIITVVIIYQILGRSQGGTE